MLEDIDSKDYPVDPLVVRLLQFLKATDGSVTILAIIFFVFMVGVGGLAVDMGRLYNAHSQFQTYVDEVTLNAASELDKEADAIVRAIRAAVGDGQAGPLITDTQDYTTEADEALAVQRMVFLQSLATDPDPSPAILTPVSGDVVLCTWEAGATTCNNGLSVADASNLANFVAVTAVPKTINYFVLPVIDTIGVLFGAPSMVSSSNISGQATAGFRREVCNSTPLMFCNPYESQVAPYGGPFTPIIGQQVQVKLKDGGSDWWVPGNFGYLQIPDSVGHPECNGGGKNKLRCLLGVINPSTQCISADVDTEPGQGLSAHVGLNMRFDIYDPPYKNEKNNPNFAAAKNVTKGKVNGPQCSSNKLTDPPAAPDPANTDRLPRDPCFETDTCTSTLDGSARFGNGGDPGVMTGLLTDYWATNHGGAALPPALAGASTRYEAYRYEANNNLMPNQSASGGENGNPTCSSTYHDQGPTGLDREDRRVILVSVINCLEHDIRGRRSNIPVIDFALMFLTQPIGVDYPGEAGAGNENTVYVEMLGVAEPGGDDGILREYPVLYR